MHLDQSLHNLQIHAQMTEQFIEWLRGHPDQLLRGARLLGGGVWASRAERVVAAARMPGACLDDVVDDLRRLRRLLSLELMDNPFSSEARRFAGIHPDHPDADDARRAFEAVTRALPSVEALRLLRVEGAA